MILFLHGGAAYGAVERYVEALVGGLRGREEVTLAYANVAALVPFARLSGKGVATAPIAPEVAFGSSLRRLAHLVRIVRRVQPRVVHVADVWPEAQLAARLAGARRLLVTHHTPELPRRDSLAGRLWWRLGWFARPGVIYTSDADRRTDARGLRNWVVPLGIDVARFGSAQPALERHDGPVIGNVARLSEQKGHRYLVEAAPRVLERYPRARFVLVGDGELRLELERAVERAGLGGSFVFAGEQDDVPAWLASFDVFAFPSLFEGLCLAVIEAQAAGVPVVATPVGGIRETVVDGATGLLCPVADPEALADGILQLLDDRDASETMAAEARRRVEQRFDLERMVAETIALYG